MRQRPKTPRTTKKFQLRMDHSQDIHVEEILNFWKSSRKQVTNLRNAVELYYALESGDMSALSKFFPALGQGGKVETPSLHQDAIVAIQKLTCAIERIQAPVAESMKVAAPKKIDVPQLAMPIIDDEDVTIEFKQAAGGTAACQSFVTAALRMVG